MQNLTAQLVIAGIQWLLQNAPGAFLAIKDLLAKPTVTDADFEAAKAQIEKDSYASIVTNSQLPPE